MKAGCKHPADRRSLLGHYDIVCDECSVIVGRVALFPCAVLTAAESQWVLDQLGDDGDSRPSLPVTKLRAAAA